MKKLLVLVGVLALVSAGTALAATATSSFNVTSSVAANCTISSVLLAFGAYDPIVTNAATPLDGTTTVTVKCTKGAPIEVGLDAGSYSAFAGTTTRAMKEAASANYMDYDLYLDSGHVTVWKNVSPDWATWTSTGKAAHDFTVYGRVPAGLDVNIGSYSDTVTATVNF